MLWFKLLHIFSVISWMAGVFYLPRIFVHYAEGKELSEEVSRLLVMAEKLLGFMAILVMFVIVTGLALWLFYGVGGSWLHYKLLFVMLLLGYHGYCWFLFQQIKRKGIVKSARFYRIVNEVPVVFLLPLLYFVVFKPY